MENQAAEKTIDRKIIDIFSRFGLSCAWEIRDTIAALIRSEAAAAIQEAEKTNTKLFADYTEARGQLVCAEKRAEVAEAVNRLCCEKKAAQQWRPIETAPKDGTDFLALCEYKRGHHQMVGCIAPIGKFVSWPGRNRYEPTHWMPLPAPPKVTHPDD